MGYIRELKSPYAFDRVALLHAIDNVDGGVATTGPFLLTLLLLDVLTADQTSRARVLNIAGLAHHRAAPLDHDNVMLTAQSYRPSFIQLPHSKLANILFTRELARRLGKHTHTHTHHLPCIHGLRAVHTIRVYPLYVRCNCDDVHTTYATLRTAPHSAVAYLLGAQELC